MKKLLTHIFFMPELCPFSELSLGNQNLETCVQDISKGIKARAIKFGTLVGAKE